MTDQCKHCLARGNMDKCKILECELHDSWFTKKQQEEISMLRKEIANLRRELSYQVGLKGLLK